MFDVGRSMFDVGIPQFPTIQSQITNNYFLTPHPRPVLVAKAFFPLRHLGLEGGFRQLVIELRTLVDPRQQRSDYLGLFEERDHALGGKPRLLEC